MCNKKLDELKYKIIDIENEIKKKLDEIDNVVTTLDYIWISIEQINGEE